MTISVQEAEAGTCEASDDDGVQLAAARPAAPESMPLERVEAELCTLAGQIAAGTCRFLQLLADFDARQGWAGWNVRSCAHWLSWRCGIDLRTAREHVRVARALAELPVTREEFAAGRISYSKARAIARVATADSEADLATAARHATAAQIERLTRGLVTVARNAREDVPGLAPVTREPSRLGMQWRWDEDGTLAVWGHLSAQDGALLLAALTRADHQVRATCGTADATGTDPASSDGSAEPQGADGGSAEPQGADGGPAEPPKAEGTTVVPRPPADLTQGLLALADLARATIDLPVHAPAADVVVHTDVAALVDAFRAESAAMARDQTCGGEPPGDGSQACGVAAHLDDGPALTTATLRMLACDARLTLAVHDEAGRTLDLGRRRRRPTSRQLTALWQRDRGCTVPGCDRIRYLHAHHVVPWALGGRTSMENLVLLCGDHHRRLHEGAFSVVALGRQAFRFHGPGGATYPAAPRLAGSATALAAAHDDIGPTTIHPDWDGTPLYLGWATSIYLDSWAAPQGNWAAPQGRAWTGGQPWDGWARDGWA